MVLCSCGVWVVTHLAEEEVSFDGVEPRDELPIDPEEGEELPGREVVGGLHRRLEVLLVLG